MTPNVPDATKTLLSATPNANVVANGQTPVTVTVSLKDVYYNPIPGRTVTLSATGGGSAIVQPTAPSNSSGQITGTLTSTQAGSVSVSISTPTLAGGPGPSASVSFTTTGVAVLQFDTSGANPQNPDNYGTANNNVSQTYVLKNNGSVSSGTLHTTMAGTNPTLWELTNDNCNNNTLGAGQACTILVTFLGGRSGQVAGSWSAVLTVNNSSSSATNQLLGVTAYNWGTATIDVSGFASYEGTSVPFGSCATKGDFYRAKLLDAPAGTQYTYTTYNNVSFLYSTTAPGNVAECGNPSNHMSSNTVFNTDWNPLSVPSSPPFVGAYWAAFGISGATYTACDTAQIYVVRWYLCQ